MRLDRYFVLFRGTCMASRTKEAVPIAGSIHCNGTKEMMQPCLICLHPISLVASSLSLQVSSASARAGSRATKEIAAVTVHRQCILFHDSKSHSNKPKT